MVSGTIFKEGCGYTLPVSTDFDVHLCVRVLPAEEQPVRDLRRQPAGPGVGHWDIVGVSREGHH